MTNTTAGRLVVEIVGDASDLIKTYQEVQKQTDTFEARLKDISTSLTKTGQKLTLGVTLPLALVGAGMVTLAGDAAETQSKFEQVFGSMSEDVESWADTYGNSVGRATSDLQEMLATSGSIVKAMGLVDDEGAKFSETLTQLAVDMGSFHNSSDIEAFNALRSAITGEYEPMKKFGVVINEAKVNQELLTMGVKDGSKAATDAEKAQARLNLIMEATADAQGDAERTAGSYSNQMKALKADITELGEEFGALLLPAAQDLISTLRGAIQTFSDLDEGTQKTIVTVGLFAAAAGPATWALGSMAGGVSSMISLYRTYQASTFAATVATKGFTAALAANPIGLAIIGLTTLAAVLIPLIAHTEDATEAQDGYNEALGKTVDLTKQTDEELRANLATLKEHRAEVQKDIDQLTQHTPAVDNDTRAISKNTTGTTYNKLAKGELTEQIKDVTDGLNDETQAQKDLTAAQYDGVRSCKRMAAANDDLKIAAIEHELHLRSLAAGAEEAYDQATKSVEQYRASVEDLQDQYDELKEAIDRALSIDEDIDDSGRDVERADIQLEKARQNLADVEKEIAAKKVEMRSTDYGSYDKRDKAEKELADLELQHREAVLDLADAEDRYTEALEEQQKLKEEKTQIEKDLNGEGIESSQARLAAISADIEEETNNLKAAQAEQTQAKVDAEKFRNLIDLEAYATRSQNLKTYVEFAAANPAIVKTFHVDYDEEGNPSYIPQIETPSVQTPTYTTADFSEWTSALAESISLKSETPATKSAASSSKAGIVIENLNVVSPQNDAATMAFQTQKALRDIGSKVAGS